MGSDSDLKVMSKAAVMLEELGIDYEMTIISAHREPCLLYTSPSPRDVEESRMPSSA